MASQNQGQNEHQASEAPNGRSNSNDNGNDGPVSEAEQLTRANSDLAEQIRILRSFLDRLIELPDSQARDLLDRFRETGPNPNSSNGQEAGPLDREAAQELLQTIIRLIQTTEGR